MAIHLIQATAELQSGHVPDAFQRFRARVPASPLLAVAAAAFVMVVPLLVWGYPRTGHDFDFHLCSWADVAHQWREGVVFPRWAALANYGYGEPRFIFYPPASWLMGAALSLVLPWKLVPGAFVCLSLVLAGASMFLLANEWLPPRYAIVAALAYVANPYHLLLIYWRWAVAELLVSALFPLLLLFAFRLCEGSRRAALGLALTFALSWLADAPGALIATYVLVLLVLAIAMQARRPRVLAAGAAALALGMGLAAFYIVPATSEQRWVHIDDALSGQLRAQDNFVTPYTDHNRRPLALAAANLIFGLALVAAGGRRHHTLPNVWGLVAMLAAVAGMMMLPISAPLWRSLPKLAFVQFPWRWLFVENAACALLFAFVLTTLRPKWRTLVVSFAVVLFFVMAGVAHATHGAGGKVATIMAAIARDHGYRGVPEYTPVGAPLRPQPNDAPRPPNSTLRAESLIVAADKALPGTLLAPLTWYPAWRADIDGRSVPVHNEAGQVAVPLASSPAVVRVYFGRTPGRLWGGVISLLALAVVVLMLVSEDRTKTIGSPVKTHEFARHSV